MASSFKQKLAYDEMTNIAAAIANEIKDQVCGEAKAGGKGCEGQGKDGERPGLTEAISKMGKISYKHDAKQDITNLKALITKVIGPAATSVIRSANEAMGLYDRYQTSGTLESDVVVVSANPTTKGTTDGLPALTEALEFDRPVNTDNAAFSIQGKTTEAELTESQLFNVKWSTSLATDIWKENLFSNQAVTSWQFFGGPDGTYVQYPAWNNKNEYSDVRTQRWYWEASAKPRIMLFALALDYSMGSRIKHLRRVMDVLLKQLTNNDLVAIIGFNTEVEYTSCFPMGFVPANQANVDNIMKSVRSKFIPGGSLNFEATFEVIDAMLHSGIAGDIVPVSPSKTFEYNMVFLHDGALMDREATKDSFERLLERSPQLRIHSYIIGEAPNHDKWQMPACLSEGTFGIIPEGTEAEILHAVVKLNQFFQLDRGTESSHGQLSFSMPYVPAGGSGDDYVISVMAPVYLQTVLPNKFIGVVGQNVRLKDLVKTVKAFMPEVGTYAFIMYNQYLGSRGMVLSHPIADYKKLLNITFFEGPEFEQKVLPTVLRDPSSSGARTFHKTFTVPRGVPEVDGMVSFQLQATYTWARVDMPLTDELELKFPFTVFIVFDRPLRGDSKSTDPTKPPDGIQKWEAPWEILMDKIPISHINKPCSVAKPTPWLDGACYRSGSINHAIQQNLSAYSSRWPALSNYMATLTNVTVPNCVGEPPHICTSPWRPRPPWVTQVSYNTSTMWLSMEGWKDPAAFVALQTSTSMAQSSSAVANQQLQQLPNDMMRIWGFLNNNTVEYNLDLPGAGPLWVVEKYNAFPIDCGTVQEAKCQIEAEALYAKGPRPNGMAMLRLFSSIEPYWVEAYQKSNGSHHQYLQRIFVNNIDGASASYPGYDVSYLSGCRPGDDTCNLGWSPSTSTIHLKSMAVWMEQRIKSWQDTGIADENNIFVLSAPSQQTVDQRTILSAATTLSVNVTSDVEYIINQELKVFSSPSAVIGVDLDYHGFSKKVTNITETYTEYYCGKKGNAGVTVECLIVDESGTLVLHPVFERPDFVPATMFIGELEPELSELLVDLHIIDPRPKQVVAASLTEVYTYVLNFDKLPQNGTFFGSQTGTYNMVRIPQTNLAFIHITGYESHGNIGYCGMLTGTCPKVTFPSQEDINFDICTPDAPYYEADEVTLKTGHLRDSEKETTHSGVPNEKISVDQRTMIMGEDLAKCDEETGDWWIWILVAILVLIVVCSALAFLLLQQEEAYGDDEDAKQMQINLDAEQEKEKNLLKTESELDNSEDQDDIGHLDVPPKDVHVEM